MFGQLEGVQRHYEELTSQMGDPSVASDPKLYQRLAREHAELSKTVQTWQAYKAAQDELESAQELLGDDDAEMRQMARAEVESLEAQILGLEETLRLLLLPKDPNDHKDVVLEIRAGTGGDEAGLFAADLLRMYARFGESQRWKVEVISESGTEIGGFKEVVAIVSGDRVYARLKFESGVHRVQRIPTTESQGRIHTSACTVAVLPEAEEVEVQIEPADLRIDTYRASGAGGQHVNKTESAIRITHLPTGLVVTCQDEKSQHKNKARALKVLASRLLDQANAAAHAEESDARKKMVGSGDRSERIRTYNFPQNRLTDHRINLTLYSLDEVMEGPALGSVVDACTAYFNAELMKGQGED